MLLREQEGGNSMRDISARPAIQVEREVSSSAPARKRVSRDLARAPADGEVSRKAPHRAALAARVADTEVGAPRKMHSRTEGDEMNAIKLLKQDHRRVEDLFKKFETAKGSSERKQRIAERTCEELELHTKLEENDFYPAVEATGDRGVELIREAEKEHAIVDDLISQLRTTSPESPEFDAAYKVLRENVEHHVGEEEGEMFPYVARVLGSGDLGHVAHRMAERKRALTAPGLLGNTLQRAKQLMSGAVDAVSDAVSELAGNSRPARKASRGAAKARGKSAARAKASSRKASKAKPSGDSSRAKAAKTRARSKTVRSSHARTAGRGR
jgi:hypothetical protein